MVSPRRSCRITWNISVITMLSCLRSDILLHDGPVSLLFFVAQSIFLDLQSVVSRCR